MTSPNKRTFLTRITYNENGWKRPSGPEGRNENYTFVAENGFGYEEWLFREKWLYDGMRYAFVQGMHCHKIRSEHPAPTFDLILFTIEEHGRRRFVAQIKNVQYSTMQGGLDALEHFKANSWYEEMLQEIEAVEGETRVFKNAEICDAPFNIRFKQDDVNFFKEPRYAQEGVEPYGLNRYRLFERDPNDPEYQALYEPIQDLLI